MKAEPNPASNARATRGWHMLIRRGVQTAAICLSAGLTIRKAMRSDLYATLHFVQYVPPMVLFAAAMISSRLSHSQRIRLWDGGLDLVAIGIAGSRLVNSDTPFSGHMVLLTYGIISSQGRKLRLFALILLIHTTCLKLFVWGDFSTWAIGAGIGILLSLIQQLHPWGKADVRTNNFL
ncbi:MAG: hypothetical protein GXP29_00405 [Planctomycetes bacterium]|nr:hypothetical protein [Planctomycetota bacterium]